MPSGGAGGAGAPNTILGPDTTYAGGGGGAGELGNSGSGGAGGGGAGGSGPNPGGGVGVAGTANTGGGGGGADGINKDSGAGGSGIVVVRAPSSFTLAGTPCAAFCGSTHPGGDKIGKFTASGTLTIGGA